MRFFLSSMRGELEKAAEEFRRRMARGATGAVNEARVNALTAGRANIGAAGFSAKWQNALRGNMYPQGRDSLKPAALIYHKIPYSEVFETGATIRGKPRMWLPLPAALQMRGGKRARPREFGKLFLLKRAGKAPLLMGQGPLNQSSGGLGRRSANAPRKQNIVPLFVGVDTVTIRKKFRIIDITKAQAAMLGTYYVKHVQQSES